MSIWDVSIELANRVYTLAYIALVVVATLTAVSTMSLFWASAIRDRYADGQVSSAQAEAATAQAQAAKANERASVLEAQAANLEKQTAEAQAATTRAQADVEREKTERARLDANVLHEQRLTANDRWRLAWLERALKPRSAFVNWNGLIAALKAGHFQPINIAVVGGAEAEGFGRDLQIALSQAGVLGRVVDPPTDPKVIRSLPDSSTGTEMLVVNAEGERLGELLWQQFQIGGGATSMAAIPSAWTEFPRDANCLLVRDNGWATAPGAGQPGEGVDQYGRPNPAP
jgi:hypothetical protein